MNQKDTWAGTTSRDNTALRWAVHLQNDLKARLKWCVTERVGDANHAPVPHLQGDATRQVLNAKTKGGKPYPSTRPARPTRTGTN